MATPVNVATRHFAVRTEQDGEGLAVRVVGEIDIATAPALKTALLGALQSEATWILVDLGQVSFCDSMGARVLMWAARECREDGDRARLRISHVPDQVRHVLELSGLGRSVPISA